jgi:hypothetical protein
VPGLIVLGQALVASLLLHLFILSIPLGSFGEPGRSQHGPRRTLSSVQMVMNVTLAKQAYGRTTSPTQLYSKEPGILVTNPSVTTVLDTPPTDIHIANAQTPDEQAGLTLTNPEYREQETLTKRPSIRHEVLLDPPDEDAYRNLTGQLSLTLLLSEEGLVDLVIVDKSSEGLPPLLIEQAVKAFAEARFNPGELGVRPVAAKMRVQINYQPLNPVPVRAAKGM